MHKLLFSFSCIFISMSLQAQSINKSEIWISSLDKASYDRVTYHVTEKRIIIKDGPYAFIYFSKNYKEDKKVFSAKLDTLRQSEFKNISEQLSKDSIKDMYDNTCIIDGLILSIEFDYSNRVISTTVSNYYLDNIAPLIFFINKIVPTKYKIYYDKKELEKEMKGCSTILN